MLALFFNLHMEHNKKQMLTLFFLHVLLVVFMAVFYIGVLDYETDEWYNTVGLCVWGCNHEVELIAGATCAVIPWPILNLVKYLFAKNMLEFGSTRPWKIQASRDKTCRESAATCLVIITLISVVIGIYVELTE